MKRKVERYENDKWINIKFKDLKIGDIFRMYENDNELVRDSENRYIFKATSNVFPNENGILSIETEAIKGDI